MASILGMGSLLFSRVSTTENIHSLHNVRSIVMVGPTCNSFLVELVHLNTGGEYLDAEPVHHQHPPVHLVGLLVVSQHITEQSWQSKL